MGKSTTDILQKTKKSIEYLKDVGSLSLERESLKLKRYAIFAELGKQFFELHIKRGIEIPELSDLISRINGITDAVSNLQHKIDSIKSSY